MAKITKAEWDKFEKRAFGQGVHEDEAIGHPVELARVVIPIALEKHSKQEVYEAAKQFADKETWPHIAFRLNS